METKMGRNLLLLIMITSIVKPSSQVNTVPKEIMDIEVTLEDERRMRILANLLIDLMIQKSNHKLDKRAQIVNDIK